MNWINLLDITSKIYRQFIIKVLSIETNISLTLLHEEASEIEKLILLDTSKLTKW